MIIECSERVVRRADGERACVAGPARRQGAQGRARQPRLRRVLRRQGKRHTTHTSLPHDQ